MESKFTKGLAVLIVGLLICIGAMAEFLIAFSDNDGYISHWLFGLALAIPGAFISAWGMRLERERRVKLTVINGGK
ncbi:hypothetical protein [Paraburkholderia sp. GAS32]|uniref:hypothetical protein n=1 Tax=Paraburkholderia sp. GAS32 TaxID=3035129 RepID=UPI003D23A155